MKLFYPLLFGFGAGILFSSSFEHLNYSVIAFLFFISFFLFLVGYFLDYDRKNKKKKLNFSIWFAVVALSFSTGCFRYQITPKGSPDDFGEYVGRRVNVVGVVSEEPEEKEKTTVYVIQVEKLKAGTFEKNISAKIIAYADKYPKFNFGDRISTNGILENISPEISDGVDYSYYVSYLAKDQIYQTISFPKITFVGRSDYGFLKGKLFALKDSFLEKINRAIPDPEASLLAGILLGEKQSYKDIQENFRKSGIMHIVVLSGYNITIVADSIIKSLSFLPSFLGLWFGASGIVLFAVMTGGTATAARASIMALIALLAKGTGRTYQMTRALFVAGFFMVLINPKILAFDSSFELSFLATLALIKISPILYDFFRFIPEKFGLREIVSTTLATQILVLPLICFRIGEFSVVSLPTNVLILSFIPITMFLGFMTGVIGFISSHIAVAIGYLAYIFLHYDIKVSEFFASFSFSVASFKVSVVGMIIFYVIIAVLYVLVSRLKREKKIEEIPDHGFVIEE